MSSSRTNSELIPLPPSLPPAKRTYYYKPKPQSTQAPRQRLKSTNRKKLHKTAVELSKTATQVEKYANIMLLASRKSDRSNPNLYNNHDPKSYRFLESINIINQTEVLNKFAKIIPKGAHHHIHFNSALSPLFLIKEARDIQDMYIKSSLPLIDVNSLIMCNIEFDIMTETTVNAKNYEVIKNVEKSKNEVLKALARSQLQPKSGQIKIFTNNYLPLSWVRYKDFQTHFQAEWSRRFRVQFETTYPSKYKDIRAFLKQETQHREGKELEARLLRLPLDNLVLPQNKQTLLVEAWLAHKLIFPEGGGQKMSYNWAWDIFNSLTKMMKGLFSYENAFRRYTRAFVIDCVHDGISVPEIRPNFMQANFLKTFNSAGRFVGDVIKNLELVGIIKSEYENTVRFLQEPGGLLRRADGTKKPFLLKIIYCTPRTFTPDQIAEALLECQKIYTTYPNLIGGFDLVGQELQVAEIKNEQGDVIEYRRLGLLSNVQKQLMEFQVYTEQRIPFLFHCGETVAPDGLVENLKTALLALPNVLRLGHGFSLCWYPIFKELVNTKDVCIETCPISNEILCLNSTCANHPIKDFMECGMACSVNSDNGTPFRTSLSHDFYQVLMGNENADLFTWKELARNSLVYSCVHQEETRKALLAEFDYEWQEACKYIVYEGA